VLSLVGLVSVVPACRQAPGGPREQGTVIGGVGGAAAGAAVAEDEPWLGALIGGALGAAGGHVIGAGVEQRGNYDGVREANDRSVRTPATATDVRASDDADLNDDGFVTTSEVVAMSEAGLSSSEMIRRLEATGQVFRLTADQRRDLRRGGVPQDVIDAMSTMNARRGEVIGRPAE
jgi:hypothetical protein